MRGCLEAAFAAPMEVHRLRLKLQQHACSLHRRRLASDIFVREFLEAELAAAAALPEKLDVQLGGEFLRLREQLRARRPLEGEKDVGCLDLGAPAMRTFHLERRRRPGEDRADLQIALLLVEHLHRQCASPAKRTMRGKCCAKLCRL